MHRVFATVALLALTSSIPAQSAKTFTAPPGYVTRDGDSNTSYFGRYASMRLQHADGTVRSFAGVLAKVDYRLDLFRDYSLATGMGRKFTSVTLDVSDTDLSKLTKTFSSNATGTPVRVFVGGVTFPTVSGIVNAAPWGKQLSFGFSKLFIYSGKQDLLTDFTFQGGTLANGDTTWTGTKLKSYYLDGVTSANTQAPQRIFVPGISFAKMSACNDSAITGNTGAYTTATATIYGDAYSTTSLRSSYTMNVSSWNTAPSAPVLQAATYGGSLAGVNVGAACHKLHIDLTRPVLFGTLTTNKGGDSTVSRFSGRYINGLSGVYLWLQSAWTDSKTKRFSLTTARRVTLPEKPKILAKRCIYETNATAKVGYSGTSGSGVWSGYWQQSLPRFTRK